MVNSVLKTMKYAVFILAVLAVPGIQCKNCTRTNIQSNVCSKPCDPAQDDCKGNRDCVCDGDCGYSCVKRDLRCPRLTNIDHGRVRYRNVTLGSVARYRCILPYTSVGSRKRTCRGNGAWDGKKPICKLTCTDPGRIPNGTRKHNGFELGKKVQYSCSPGFTMQGSSTLTCTRTGAWDRNIPNCTCKRTNNKAFRYCTRQCNPDSNSCNRNKECVCDGDCGYSCVTKDLECRRPSALENGRREYSSTKLGSTVRYQCNKPYTLLGSKIRTCRGIRDWDGTEPSCKIICQDPGDIEFANLQPNFDDDYYVAVGARAEYSCFPGFEMVGSKFLTCNKTGEWDRTKPKCILRSCDPPKLPESVEVRGRRKASYKYSDRVSLKCKAGYFMMTTTAGVMQCDMEGWKWILPKKNSFNCSPKSCGDPGVPQNGKPKSYTFTFPSRVYFECYNGYKLVGDKYRQCQANQRWSGRLPTCEPIDCGVLPTPDNAKKVLETTTRMGGVVRFQCKEKGYEISGSEIRTCQSNGLWDGFPTSCKILNCGKPSTPAHGNEVGENSYNYGSSVDFACKENYTLAGKSRIYCEETKDWSSPSPRCWAPCPDPGVPGNGSRTGDDFKHDKSVIFKCQGDFELKGDAIIRCRDGRWIDDIPKCKVISCDDPGSPAHGRQSKVSNNFAIGGFVRFKCDTNYTLQGKKKITCQRNKTWNGEPPKCLASCPDPGHPTNGKAIGGVFDHDSVVQFECLNGRFLKGSSVTKCNDGKWNQELPTCIDCGGGIPLGMTSGDIQDKSINASSKTDEYPAHHGRLGGDSYWCSKEEKISYLQILLPRKYKIFATGIQFKSAYNIKAIKLKVQVLNKWRDFHQEKPPYSEGVERISPSEPFITQSLRIRVIKKEPISICMRAEVYGCEIPRGCIMKGSAVLVKHSSGYHKRIVGYIFSSINSFEVFQSGKSRMMKRGDVILDEKPSAHELSNGTLVVGEDVNSPGLIREGRLVQRRDLLCTIKTNDDEWFSNVNDVRVVKKSEFCQHKIN